ncbi:amidohydrolase [Halomonas sp. DP8Y7-3]|uniref:M20 aminoacylase family protein n=1 Tax=Halomonas sp. DP8Y7-3 TaxID=2859079 RepID=UPI001C93BB85|nr:M20 aminoacylase family protein [Halomonas sp. DP8Y7-3]MBY5929979.1 amidohydrolase [Halomonas sp. DP8Y7-3]
MTLTIDTSFFDDQLQSLTELRHHFHRHPELGFKEHATSARVCEELERLDIPYEKGLGGTGVVATIKGLAADNGRRIGLRADMDALPIQEASDHAHASAVPGIMHACGHDGHTTMLIGAARYLARHRNFSGIVYLVFQPAEEGLGGGREMVKDGLFERYPMDAIYGLHNWPALPRGQVAIRPGPIMAATDRLDICVRGKGGHGGVNPHLSIDPVRMAGALIQALHSVVSRDADPLSPAALSLCGIKGGELDGFAIIPDEVRLSGTVRTLDLATQDRIADAIARTCDGVAATYGGQIEVDHQRIFPATINHSEATQHVIDTAREVLGESALEQEVAPSLGGEDFAFMLEQCPGAYFFLGSADTPDTPPLHNARYDFNDAVIPTGSQLLVAIALEGLAKTS